MRQCSFLKIYLTELQIGTIRNCRFGSAKEITIFSSKYAPYRFLKFRITHSSRTCTLATKTIIDPGGQDDQGGNDQKK